VAQRGPALTRVAYLLLHDHHLAQDLTQETFARLHRNWARVSVFDDPDAYARKIMLNQMLSWRRRRWWSERSSADLAEVGVIEDIAAEGAERDAMWLMLQTLSAHQRAVIVLRFYEDLDDNSIATILGCSASTVRSHASKGLARLRNVAGQPMTAGGQS
jgi:RNA polymerase sigma-70 factor (sigma-E family)